MKPAYRVAKRVVDVTASVALLVLFAPVMALVALLVRARLGTPVIFAQRRPGLHERPFTLYKFRTLSNETDATGALLPDTERLTPFGRWMRSTSLDELPELINVLRGDMSLVGPRPLLPDYLPLYTPQQRRRHDVRPGVTGWAQVNGRNAVSWDERFAMDLWYVENASLLLDFRILARTVLGVVKGEGVTTADGNLMPRFQGGGPASRKSVAESDEPNG